jgi:hypothetical protein
LDSKCEVVNGNGISWGEILEKVRQQGLCMKIFRSLPKDETDVGGFLSEMERLKKMEALNIKDIDTTHRRVLGQYGFTMKLLRGSNVNLDGKKLNEVSVMFLEKCQNFDENNGISYVGRIITQYIMEDLGSMLRKLHQNGYAHGDIKYENIVLCGNNYKFIDVGMVTEKTAFESPSTFSLCAPVFLNAWRRSTDQPIKTYEYYNDTNDGKSPYNYRYFIEEYVPDYATRLEGENGLWNTLFKNGSVMDIYKYNDQYGLAYMLHQMQTVDKDKNGAITDAVRIKYIKDLLTIPGYFDKNNASSVRNVQGGALKLTRKGTVEILGRTRALYVTNRGKHYIRHQNQWVAVAELKKKKH